MTQRKDLLDRIDVREPCTESWEEMTGNEEVRFCSHCSKNVYDLSSYTRQRAEKLVRDSNGNLCVRYRKDERGRVVTAPPKFTHIKRHAKIAAGVLATTISVASMAYTQGCPRPIKQVPTAEKRDKRPNTLPGFVVSGIVTDLNGAVVAGVKVVLSNSSNSIRRVTQTDVQGSYKFKDVPEDVYRIEFELLPFKRHIVENLQVSADVDQPMSLELSEEVILMGVVGVSNEIVLDGLPPVISSDITPQRLLELPRTQQGPFVTDFFPSASKKPSSTTPAKKSKKKLPK
ncbi:MAG: carboxypeptidase-like regulatory domain-containing protein [Pyrinomonadaceae bacterium]